MNPEGLRNAVAADLQEAIGDLKEQLAISVQAPLDQLRAWQGQAQGLKMALNILDERYRKL